MAKLIALTNKTYYLRVPTRIGMILLDSTDVCVIDSGIDADAGALILSVLEEQRWQLRYLINTHGHADHVGGNRFLQDKTGCTVLGYGINADMTRDPLINSSMLYGGKPGEDLKGRFFYAQPSKVYDLKEEPERLPDGLTLLSLPGHAADMIGILTNDGVAFIGDALCSEKTLAKNPITFLYDVEAALSTLQQLHSLPASVFVPSHADSLTDVSRLIDINRQAIMQTQKQILEILETPMLFEHLLKALLDKNGLTLDFSQYALVGSTVRSYLSYLRDSGKICPHFENNLLMWEVTK